MDGSAYTKAFGGRGHCLKKFYIDGFSGAGVHLVKRTRQQIKGSPARALKITPPFDRFYFIDLNKDKTAYLQKSLYQLAETNAMPSGCCWLSASLSREGSMAGREKC
jgi:three-Cys-motif partner protein